MFVAATWSLDQLGLTRLHKNIHSLELDSPEQLNRAQWLGNVSLTETWRSKVWGGGSPMVYTRVAWSLCYEEQFYLVCFLTLLVASRRLHLALGILTAAIVGFRVFAYDSGWIANYRGMFPDYWHEFAVGLAVYWRLVAAPSRRATHAVDAALVALMVVGLASGFRSTWVASGFGLALIALRRFDSAARLPWLAPFRACGRRCYSIYLIHLPVCTIGNEFLIGLGIVGFWPRALLVIRWSRSRPSGLAGPSSDSSSRGSSRSRVRRVLEDAPSGSVW